MSTKRVKTWLISLLAFFLSSAALANVDHDLNSFFKGLGYQSNVTSPSAFQGQAAGYYTGGSLFLRNQVKSYQLLSVELPSFSGGCSGIDAFLGSFSVINSAQLIQMMKNIMSSAGSYAFDLALSSTVPQIKSVKDRLQKYINDVNNANINSCNTAEDLVGGAWPKTQAAQQQICRDVGSHNGVFSDWAKARQGCGTGGQFDQGMGDGGNRKAEVIVNKNIVWDALLNNGLTKNDQELAEMLMSLSGSIVIKKNGDKTSRMILPSMTHSQEIIRSLLYGGHAKIYICDEESKCLNPSKKTIAISQSNGLVYQVESMIDALNADVSSDNGTLSEKTRGFLEMTPFPILKHISTSLSMGRAINSSEFSEAIAITLLQQYLSENIQMVKASLRKEDTPMTPDMLKQINEAQRFVSTKMSNSYRKLSNVNDLIRKMRSNERQLVSRLSSVASVGQEAR